MKITSGILLLLLTLTQTTKTTSPKAKDASTPKSEKTIDPDASAKTPLFSHISSLHEDQLTVDDLEDLVKFDQEDSDIADMSLNSFLGITKSHVTTETEQNVDWMLDMDKDQDTQPGRMRRKRITDGSDDKDVDEDQNNKDKAKIELLEITAENRISYTEIQVVVKFMEDKLNVPKIAGEENLKESDYQERKSQLSEGIHVELGDLKKYVEALAPEKRIELHDELVQNLESISEFSFDPNTQTSAESSSGQSSSSASSESSSQKNDQPSKKPSDAEIKQNVKELNEIIKKTSQDELKYTHSLDVEKVQSLLKDKLTPKNAKDELSKLASFANDKDNSLKGLNGDKLMDSIMGAGGVNPDVLKNSLTESFRKLISNPEMTKMIQKITNTPKFQSMRNALGDKNLSFLDGMLGTKSPKKEEETLPVAKPIEGTPENMKVRKEQRFEDDRKDLEEKAEVKKFDILHQQPKFIDKQTKIKMMKKIRQSKLELGNAVAFGRARMKRKQRVGFI